MAVTHYSEPYALPARQWQAFAEGTRLRLVLGEDDHEIRSADYVDDRLLVTLDTGDVVYFGLDETLTVRAPRTTFAALLPRLG